MAKIKRPSKKIVYLVAAAIFIASGIAIYIESRSTSNAPRLKTPTNEKINYGPPTEEEKQQAVDNKKRIDDEEAQRNSQANQNSDGKKSVTPVISYAEQSGNKIEVGSYVPGIFEDGGTCIATFSKNGAEVTKQVLATKEGNSTFCPLFSVSSSEFPEKGTWLVVVSYVSATSSGASGSIKLVIK